MSEDHNLKDAAEAVRGIVEAVPIYQDALQPAAKEVGTALQTVAKTLHVLLAPVGGLVWGYEKMRVFVSERVAEKLKDAPNARLRSPEPHVAGPALEALKYTGYQDHLREPYAGLLATAIDSKTAHVAQPCFVEIIKQMSPDEALIMRSLASAGIRPIIDVRKESKSENLGIWVLRHFSLVPFEAGCKHPDLGGTYLINLERLGLIEFRENYTLKFGPDDLYKTTKERPEIQQIVAEIAGTGNHKPTINSGAIIITKLGEQFCFACILEGTHTREG